MNNYLVNFKLSKNSFKFIAKAQWNNLSEIALSKYSLNLDNCNLNDESVKIIVKCTFQSLKKLYFHNNCFSDKCYEILCEPKLNKL